MDKRVVVYGAGGHGKVVADAALACGWSVIRFADDDPAKRGGEILGVPVALCGVEECLSFLAKEGAQIAMGIGANAARQRIFTALAAKGVSPVTLIHPRACIAPSVVLGMGTVVFAGAVINADTQIGENVIVNTAASIDHDNRISDHVHVSPGARLGGTVAVGEGAHIGIGATIKNNICVGAWTVVGAGAVVVRHLGERVVAVGVPARPMEGRRT